MKLSSAFCPVALSALLTLAPVGLAFAQTPDPTATVVPSKPAAETATPSPGAAVNTLPASTPEATAAPKRKKASPEQRAARKKERLEKYDTNKDGKIDPTEREAMKTDMAKTPKAKVSPTP